MFKFCEHTLHILNCSGWTKDRRAFVVDDYVKALEKEGFAVSKNIKDFLYVFGGLSIKHPHAKCKSITDFFHFDVVKALNSGDTGWVLEVYSSRVGKNLCIIGEAYRRSMILCMASDKAVYAGIDEKLFYVGDSGESAIEALCNGNEIKEIPEYYPKLEAAQKVYGKHLPIFQPRLNDRIQKNLLPNLYIPKYQSNNMNTTNNIRI